MGVAKSYFVDTSFWISLLIVSDDHHARALQWQQKVVAEHNALLSTEAVLWEVLNYFSAPRDRQRGIQLYRGAHSRREMSVQDFDPDLCEDAVRLYAARPDKEWGMVDCFSFELMRSRGIRAALTADHHFEQAGFTALLLHEPSSFIGYTED